MVITNFLNHFYFIGKVHHFSRKNDIFIYAHNNGTESNIHYKEPTIKVSDNNKCKIIQNGGGSIARDVCQLKTRGKEYYEENDVCRFPPSYYLQQDSTCKWAEKLETLFKTESVKIIVGFQPIDYLTLVGLEENEYQQIIDNPAATFNNSVIVINVKKRWLMVSIVTNAANKSMIGMELIKLDDLLKTIYHVNWSAIQNEFVAIVGILVTPNIDSHSTLKTYYPIQMEQGDENMFITKMEWNSDQLLHTWMKDLFGKKICPEIKNNMSGIEQFF